MVICACPQPTRVRGQRCRRMGLTDVQLLLSVITIRCNVRTTTQTLDSTHSSQHRLSPQILSSVFHSSSPGPLLVRVKRHHHKACNQLDKQITYMHRNTLRVSRPSCQLRMRACVRNAFTCERMRAIQLALPEYITELRSGLSGAVEPSFLASPQSPYGKDEEQGHGPFCSGRRPLPFWDFLVVERKAAEESEECRQH